MRTITVTYRSSLPMFLGGASDVAEFRLTSFKGALRFWWRSLHWNTSHSVEAMRAKENHLFGSSEQAMGRSKIRMRLIRTEPKQLKVIQPKSTLHDDGCPGANYLAYGKIKTGKKAGEFEKPALAPYEFTLELLISPALSEEDIESVRRALRILGMFGGLGGRSRRGWGSLTMTNFKESVHGKELSTEFDPTRIIMPEGIHRDTNGALPEWTAWSTHSRVVVLKSQSKDPISVLNSIGIELLRFRSWGKGGTVLGDESEKRFINDHNLFKNKTAGSNLPVKAGMNVPERIAFGLPHNYGKEDYKWVAPADENLDRRASPLFIHVHQTAADAPAVGILAFLPARFLPSKSPGVTAFGSVHSNDTTAAIYKPVGDFLDRMTGKGDSTNQNRSTLIGQELPCVQ